MLTNRTALLNLIVSLILTPHLSASKSEMIPVEDKPVVQTAGPDQHQNLDRMFGAGEIILGGQELCPDFPHFIRKEIGDVLNQKQQAKLAILCEGNTYFRSDNWSKALRMLEEFNSSGLSHKPHFTNHVTDIAQQILHRDCSSFHHMPFVLDPAIMRLCTDAKDTLQVLDLILAKRLDVNRYKEEVVKRRRQKNIKPSKSQYERLKINPSNLKWLIQSGALDLCQNIRDLKQLLGILGKEYNMPLWEPISTLKKKPQWLYWQGSKFSEPETDNILGWLQFAGVLRSCQNLIQVQQIFDLLSACPQHIRIPFFQMSEKSGIFKNNLNAQNLLDLLHYMTARNSREDHEALRAMKDLGVMPHVTSLDEVIEIFERLTSYEPIFEHGEREARNEVHLRALSKSGALALCERLYQLDQLLQAVRGSSTIRLLKCKHYGQRFKNFDHLMNTINKLNASSFIREKLAKFFSEYPSWSWCDKHTELRNKFSAMIHGLRLLDRDLAKDIVYLNALMLPDEKDTCPHREYGRICREDACKMPMLIRRFLECTLDYHDEKHSDVVDLVLDWTPEPANGESCEDLVSIGRSLMLLTQDERHFFLSLPFEAFGLYTRGRCVHDTFWEPIKGPTISTMIAVAASLPPAIREKTIKWILDRGLNDIPMKDDRVTIEGEQRLQQIKKIFDPWLYVHGQWRYGYGASWNLIEENLKELFPEVVEPKGKEEASSSDLFGKYAKV